MFRWVETDNGYYREKFVPIKTIEIKNENLELDHYAYRYLQTEVEMYKIMDINFINYINNRGDVTRLGTIKIPTEA